MAFADDTFETETFRSESLPDFSAEDDIQERETDYFLTLVNGVKKIDVGGRRRDPANARKADNFRDKIGNLKVLKNVAIVFENFKQRYAGLELSFDTIRKGIERISDVEKKIGYYMWTLHTREDELLAKIQQTKAALQEQHLKEGEVLAERRTLTDAHFSSITKEKRALQLAELLADVLENEWQQTFLHTRTQLPDVPNENVIIELREALKVCYEMCIQLSSQQRAKLHRQLLLAPDSKAVTPKGVLLASKELQVVSAPVTLPVVYQMMLQHVRSSADIPLLQRACGGLQEPLVSYLQRCTKICWFLQTHEPPIMLDFTGSKPEHYATYMEQTYTGDLDYVVWPVVRSQEGSVGYLLQGSAKFHNFKTTESPSRRRPVPPPPSPQPTSVPWDEYRKEGLYYFTTDT